jgi:hypothetical protein
MRPHLHPHASSAPRGEADVGGAWIDSGITPGLVVVDSNRPSIDDGRANGLLGQALAPH